MNQTKLSVIIPIYNCINKIEQTIDSVLCQTAKNLELIIIDGKSTDGTLEFVTKNYAHQCTIVSEEDKGIYDAMNNGINLAKGEWLYFLNAGDYLVNNTVIQKVYEYFEQAYTLIYGGYKMYFPNGVEREFTPKKISSIAYDMPTCHQAIFYHHSLFKDYKYDISHPWCADHIHLAKVYKAGLIEEIKLDMPIAFFEAGGDINRNQMEFISDRIKVANHFLPSHRVLAYYLKLIWYNILRKKIKKIFIHESKV